MFGISIKSEKDSPSYWLTYDFHNDLGLFGTAINVTVITTSFPTFPFEERQEGINSLKEYKDNQTVYSATWHEYDEDNDTGEWIDLNQL